jgi:hypothetical protein
MIAVTFAPLPPLPPLALSAAPPPPPAPDTCTCTRVTPAGTVYVQEPGVLKVCAFAGMENNPKAMMQMNQNQIGARADAAHD